uniref:Uncharacterized protein n=1 Tax=Vespula pensylvanica TaxID=30213 RepID=A0A834NG21_VESPE|nr:hypothetical protein H0235_014325 [Vespula pensylvanica]
MTNSLPDGTITGLVKSRWQRSSKQVGIDSDGKGNVAAGRARWGKEEVEEEDEEEDEEEEEEEEVENEIELRKALGRSWPLPALDMPFSFRPAILFRNNARVDRLLLATREISNWSWTDLLYFAPSTFIILDESWSKGVLTVGKVFDISDESNPYLTREAPSIDVETVRKQ